MNVIEIKLNIDCSNTSCIFKENAKDMNSKLKSLTWELWNISCEDTTIQICLNKTNNFDIDEVIQVKYSVNKFDSNDCWFEYKGVKCDIITSGMAEFRAIAIYKGLCKFVNDKLAEHKAKKKAIEEEKVLIAHQKARLEKVYADCNITK